MPYFMCPHDEPQRLLELQRLKAMENVLDKSYGNYTLLASSVCAAPASAISLIDSDQQWFRATVGMNLKGTPRSISFCTHAIMQNNIYIVNNAHNDPDFQDNPLVVSEPHIRFYAGVPLLTSRGHNLGTLCVMDTNAKTLSPEQVNVLKVLAEQIVIQLEESITTASLSVTLSRLHTFLDHMDFAVLLEDEDGCILYVNDCFDRMFPNAFKLTQRKVQVERYSLVEDLSPSFVQADTFLKVVKSMITGRSKKPGHELRTIQGRILEMDYIPTVDQNQYRGHIWIFRDVTEQRQFSEQMEQQKMQVMQAEKLAVLGEMAAGLAHEINNPLAIIHGQAHCLRVHVRKDVINVDAIEKSVESIEKTSWRIARVVQGLRAFAREDGHTPPQWFTIQQLIDDALMFCESRIRNHGFQLHITPFPSDLSIWCRPIQITQVLVNLLNNAFDACKINAEVDQWIEIQVMTDEHNVTLRVIDSGPGIPRELGDKIMLPFFTTKEIGKGSGLGLSIAKGIVESHRGHFFLDGTAPHTTFVMSFPIDLAPSPLHRPEY